jgi:SAM-dependent methyltransferase
MQKQREDQVVWESYWGARRQSLQNPLGKRRAVVAAFQIIEGLAAESARPVRIIELGCGEGHILGELLKMCETSKLRVGDCAGVDNQECVIESARRLYPQVSFSVADYAEQPLDLQPFDLVMMVGTLHEVYSGSRPGASREIDPDLGKKAVAKALRHAVRLIGGDRYLVLFDGVEHPLPGLQIVVRFNSDRGMNEFKKIVSEYEAFRLSYEEAEGRRRVRMSMRDFTRYITKTRFFNSGLWEIEKWESYQYFTEDEFKKCLGEIGVDVLKLQCSTPRQKDWEDRVTIETPGVAFPQENILIVGRKIEKTSARRA